MNKTSFFRNDQLTISSLLNYMSSIHPLTDELTHGYQKSCQVLRAKKNKYILSPIDQNRYMYFVAEGKIRGFVRENNQEITTFFAFEEEIITAAGFSSPDEHYSPEYLQALDDCIIVCIPLMFLETTYLRFPEANIIQRKILAIQNFNARQRSILARIPKANLRYERLMEDPKVKEAGIPLRYLASYLSIRLETLSRLRKKEFEMVV